jgi:uridine phosphorylase
MQATGSPDPCGSASAVAQMPVLGLGFDPNHIAVIPIERAGQEAAAELFLRASTGGGVEQRLKVGETVAADEIETEQRVALAQEG